MDVDGIVENCPFLENECEYATDRSKSLVVAKCYGVAISISHLSDGLSVEIQKESYGSRKFSLSTLVGALQRHRDVLFSDPECQLRYYCDFLSTNMRKLTAMPEEIFEDCAGLSFWHSPRWRGGWGSSIEMNEENIALEKSRLRRLQTYFDVPKQRKLP